MGQFVQKIKHSLLWDSVWSLLFIYNYNYRAISLKLWIVWSMDRNMNIVGINHLSFSIKARSMLLGRSIGNPKARDQIPLDRQPRALETPKTTV